MAPGGDWWANGTWKAHDAPTGQFLSRSPCLTPRKRRNVREIGEEGKRKGEERKRWKGKRSGEKRTRKRCENRREDTGKGRKPKLVGSLLTIVYTPCYAWAVEEKLTTATKKKRKETPVPVSVPVPCFHCTQRKARPVQPVSTVQPLQTVQLVITVKQKKKQKKGKDCGDCGVCIGCGGFEALWKSVDDWARQNADTLDTTDTLSSCSSSEVDDDMAGRLDRLLED